MAAHQGGGVFSLPGGVKKGSKGIKGRKSCPGTGFLTTRGLAVSEGGTDMRIGYARASTYDQNLDLQKDALQRAGCEKVIVDKAGGKTTKRSGRDRAQQPLNAPAGRPPKPAKESFHA
jgi:hypothetical protein